MYIYNIKILLKLTTNYIIIESVFKGVGNDREIKQPKK